MPFVPMYIYDALEGVRRFEYSGYVFASYLMILRLLSGWIVQGRHQADAQERLGGF